MAPVWSSVRFHQHPTIWFWIFPSIACILCNSIALLREVFNQHVKYQFKEDFFLSEANLYVFYFMIGIFLCEILVGILVTENSLVTEDSQTFDCHMVYHFLFSMEFGYMRTVENDPN